MQDLGKPEAKKAALEIIRKDLEHGQQSIFKEQIVAEAEARYEAVVTEFRKNDIRQYVFMGFKKSCHPEYTFNSSSELTFTNILEYDPAVEKWLRPAPTQFSIYWHHQTRKYQPDFVVETKNAIYMVEVKAANEVEDQDVTEKARAGRVFCEKVLEYMRRYGKKPWVYMLVPHDEVRGNATFGGLGERFG